MVDSSPETEEARAVNARIGLAWKELRRGAAMAALREHLFGCGEDALEPGQWDTLELLVQRDAWRMSELADALRVDASTATRAVQRLLRIGLAERRPHEDDGRVVTVSPTASGRRRYDAIASSRREVMSRVMDEFDLAEREQLASLLERFVVSLDREADRAARSARSSRPPERRDG
jgi:DNA-binding MarR family transcriptional regulator